MRVLGGPRGGILYLRRMPRSGWRPCLQSQSKHISGIPGDLQDDCTFGSLSIIYHLTSRLLDGVKPTPKTSSGSGVLTFFRRVAYISGPSQWRGHRQGKFDRRAQSTSSFLTAMQDRILTVLSLWCNTSSVMWVNAYIRLEVIVKCRI